MWCQQVIPSVQTLLLSMLTTCHDALAVACAGGGEIDWHHIGGSKPPETTTRTVSQRGEVGAWLLGGRGPLPVVRGSTYRLTHKLNVRVHLCCCSGLSE